MGCIESTPVARQPVYYVQQYPVKNNVVTIPQNTKIENIGEPVNYPVQQNQNPPPYNPNYYPNNQNYQYAQQYPQYIATYPPQYPQYIATYPPQYPQQYYPNPPPYNPNYNNNSMLGTFGAVVGGVIVGDMVADALFD